MAYLELKDIGSYFLGKDFWSERGLTCSLS